MSFFDRLFGRKTAPNAEHEPKSSAWPHDLPPLDTLVAQLHQKYSRPASLMIADRQLRPEDPKASWLGQALVGRPGEHWPEWNGRPMVGLCQINLREAPHVPESLRDLALITVFMARGGKGDPIDIPLEGEPHGEKWLVRAYENLEDLIPYPNPPAPPRELTPCAVRYRIISDPHPNPDEFEEVERFRERYPDKAIDRLVDSIGDQTSEEIYGSKVGGWPAPIQDPDARPLAFQLGSEEQVGLNWIDAGCVYFWRRPGDATNPWEMDIQFY